MDSPGYYLLLGAVAIFILGPLGGITAAYMNFSIGFFVGGQVLAGILGSVVTYGYGSEGKHGANYIQTMAASVAGLSGMAVLIQAMTWLGLPEPPIWQLIVYFMCIGMFGVGVGMMYTPILVDRMQLSFPSGFAVANILRALTDIRLLKESICKLGGGTAGGLLSGLALASPRRRVGRQAGRAGPGRVLGRMIANYSASTLGAGMIVGARIGIPAIVVGGIGMALTPWLRTHGLNDAAGVMTPFLGPHDPFRKIAFICALGMIMGAAIVDMAMLAGTAISTFGKSKAAEPAEDWKKTDSRFLWSWVAFWAIAIFAMGVFVLHLPALFVGVAIALVFVFLMVNGISLGISDSNPISSAFVLTVFILATIGLKDPVTGLLCATILLIATSVGGDMQQDRSTGWRLGTNRSLQFRYQVIGIAMGAVMSVVLARLFMKAYPVLAINQFANPGTPGAEKWQAAMTYKFVGALNGLTHPNPNVMLALGIGIAIGLITEVLRKAIKRNGGYKAWVARGGFAYYFDLSLDCIFLPTPYASSFGGFVEFGTSLWFGLGGTFSSLLQTWQAKQAEAKSAARAAAGHEDLPEDMSTMSLVGGGLIAGDSLAALGLGIYGLLQTVVK
ncbi:MAG: OPT/YSL family transporter [Candidatus Eisenbacteria bacterium]|nr:OPT/YSL family transporter [Candidatus Eisenbacteria bacterium]